MSEWVQWFKTALEKAGFTIPFPQRDVHVYPEKPALAENRKG